MKMNKQKTMFVLFGSTGDLAKKKIIPALNKLAEHLDLKVLCFGRKNFTTKQYVEYLQKAKIEVSSNLELKYLVVNLENSKDVENICDLINHEDKDKSGLRLFYLATANDYFEKITESVSKCRSVPIRVLFEKPFGNNLESFLKLEKSIKKYLNEEEIYRVDHYLAKETIENILSLRLANPFFEKTWNSQFIDEIKIVVNEDFGVEDRLEYYDKTGAIKDMLQNHLLQIAAFVLMDAPKAINSKNMDYEKTKAIKSLKNENLEIGQYKDYKLELKNKGYQESNTETYVEASFKSTNKRWKGTKITLITGKKLDEKRAYIQIIYKKDPCTLYCDINTKPNIMTINIQPKQCIDLSMNVRTDSEKNIYETIPLGVPSELRFSANTKESYLKILEECIKGNKESFLTANQLEAAWIITDVLLKNKNNKNLKIY